MAKILLEITPNTMRRLISALDNGAEALYESAERRRDYGEKDQNTHADQEERDANFLSSFIGKLKKHL